MDEGDVVRAQLATFVAERDRPSFLHDAGPADDGTYDAARVAANVEGATAAGAALDQLASCLHQSASYALFLARPHLRRMEEARTGKRPRISQRITALLAPIAPKVGSVPDGDPNKGG